jgi:hypothetical protein
MGALVSQKATAYRASIQTTVIREVTAGYHKPLETFHYRDQQQGESQERPVRGAVVAPSGVLIRLNTVEHTTEAPPFVNQAAIALLRSWRNEDPAQQRKDWESLKQVLEEDRPSDRKLFP